MPQLIINPRNVVDTVADLAERVDPTNSINGGVALDKTLFHALGGSAVGDGQGGLYVYRTSGRPPTESMVIKPGPDEDDYFELVTQVSTQTKSVQTVTADYSATTNDGVIFVDSTSNDVTVSLPAPTAGAELTIKNIDASNTVTVSGNQSAVSNPDDPELAASWSTNADTTVTDATITDHVGNASRNALEFGRVGTDAAGSSFYILSSEAAVSFPITVDVWIYRDAAAPNSNSVTLSLFGATHTATTAEILNASGATVAVVSGLVNVDSLPDGFTQVRLYSPTGAARLIVYPVDSSSGENGATLGPNVLYDFQIYRSHLIDGASTFTLAALNDSIDVIGDTTAWRIV
jgi:hypothetical protein